ncbi:hypothetical protein [Anaeromyxobacter oryzae]|uniref:DUF4178 domain-containing protein n=1 Tax=Anaeromyxobacter oryzae TaxID=2918170 RepID=A0ABM7WVJ9_9BACT|nr:hypothetical protein [Anaeromyxobacter oryzae]BDG03536.1 hypothetical protein AMOR_25320 [Anaeromyxobacter oryzae]
MATSFQKLNDGWNADPNAPAESVHVRGDTVFLEFYLNAFVFKAFAEGDRARLTFTRCSRYRLGSTNDEGWYRGQCRVSKLAPAWGELYEVTGDLLDQQVSDWVAVPPAAPGERRRFLFYLRDSTFEVDAQDWKFEVLGPGPRVRREPR